MGVESEFSVRLWPLPSQTITLSSPAFNTFYTQNFVETLPNLAQERGLHGCGYYMDTGNTMVGTGDSNNNNHVTYAQVLVVAGGYANGNAGYLSSTEVLTSGATSWQYGGSLPRAFTHPASVNMESYILFIGCKLFNNI